MSSSERDPYRIVGLGLTLMHGYSGAVGLEGIGGADPLIPANDRRLLLALHLPIEWGWRVQVWSADVAPLAGALDFLNVRYPAGMPSAANALSTLSAVTRWRSRVCSAPV